MGGPAGPGISPDGLILGAQHLFSRLGSRVERIVFVVASVLLIFLSVILFTQVIFRYVLELPLPWSEESARFSLVWLGMLAAGITARRGLHFVFRWVVVLLPQVVLPWLRLAVNVLIAAFLALLLLLSLDYLELVSNQTSQATGVNMAVPYAGVTAGAIVLMVLYAFEILDGLCSLSTGQRLSEPERQEAAMIAILKGEGTDDVDIDSATGVRIGKGGPSAGRDE